jgi:hypothetical protein
VLISGKAIFAKELKQREEKKNSFKIKDLKTFDSRARKSCLRVHAGHNRCSHKGKCVLSQKELFSVYHLRGSVELSCFCRLLENGIHLLSVVVIQSNGVLRVNQIGNN